MKKPILSIVIPTYNRASLLEYTLISIKNQTIDSSEYEVIIADDGSTDNTLEILEAHRHQLHIIYCFQEDLGYRPASARNLGITKASGEIILFIDSGIILHPNCIEEHLLSHSSNKTSFAVIGNVLGIEEEYDYDEVLSKQIDYLNPKATIEAFQSNGKYLDIREVVYESCGDNIMALQLPWILFWTGNISIKKSEIDRVKGFDVNFDGNWGIEDIDMGYRIFKNGVPIILNRNASSVHCPHFSNTAEKLRQEKTNKLYFIEKHKFAEAEEFLKCTAIQLNFALKKAIVKNQDDSVNSL